MEPERLPRLLPDNNLDSKEKLVRDYPTLVSLLKIKGIGGKALSDLKRNYNSVDELKIALKEDKVSLRDDQVEILRKELL